MVTSKTEISKKSAILEFLESPSFKNCMLLLVFALVFTLLLASKHFFFRSLIDENNIARQDVYAEKQIEVVDVYKTDQRRKELAQKLDPVMRPAEDTFIMNDLDNFVASMYQVKISDLSTAEKHAKLLSMIDLSDSNRASFLASFFLNSSNETIETTVAKAKHTLRSVLIVGITEKDINDNNILKIE